MNFNSGVKIKQSTKSSKHNYYLTPTKKKPSNTTLSTQSEDKPVIFRPSNYLNNTSKIKISHMPFVLKKQMRNNELIDNDSDSKLIQPNSNGRNMFNSSSQASGNTTNFIPYLKLTNSIDNVSKLIQTSSMSNLIKQPQNSSSTDNRKLAKSESSANVNKALIQQLVRNESFHSLLNKDQSKDQAKDNRKLSSTKSECKFTSPVLRKCFSFKSIPKKDPLNEKEQEKERESIVNVSMIITTYDLLLIEDKIQDILNTIQEGYTISNECLEWWNFYFSSTIAGNYEEYFLNTKNKKKIRSYVNIELLCMMICYSLSFDNDLYKNYIKEFKAIISFLHFNLLLIIKFIMSIQKIHDYSYIKLDMMIKKSLSTIKEKDIDEFFISSLINHNVAEVGNIYKQIIEKEFQLENDKSLKSFFNYAYENRESISVEEFDEFFRFNLIHVNNLEGSVLASSIKGANPIPVKLKLPFLPIMVHFKYTLVLDLDETLVHLKDKEGNSKGQLLFRPGLFQFLQKMKNRFEMVVFTVGTKEVSSILLI